MKSWIRGEEYVINTQVVASTLSLPLVVASTLSLPLVQQLVYPYDETLPFDDIMSLIAGTSI